jgi:tetratricopeptide (TPR) repeat protein
MRRAYMRGPVITRNHFSWLIISILAAAFGVQAQQAAQTQDTAPASASSSANASTPETLPVTTSSSIAREAYDMGMVQREDRLFIDEGLSFFREAVKADPHFALAHAALGYFTPDPAEGRRESALAAKYASTASPDEQLLIRWMNGTKNGELVPAISAMNDLLAKYPHDTRLANLDGEWLCSNQDAFDHGEEVLKRLLDFNPDYYPAMNNLAYCYALSGQPQLAPPFMEEYVAALPNEPNPQDSFGEIMRMLGDYPAALEHYRKALQINPGFSSSQLGIASTYALMGDEKRARVEYLKAINVTKERSTRLQYRTLWALTFYRENELTLGRQEMVKLDRQAHAAGLLIQNAEIHRTMALFNPNANRALRDLDDARADLMAARGILPGDRDLELATILQTRAYIAAEAGKSEAAQSALKPLAQMAQTSRSLPIQGAYHSANGAVLFAKGDFAGAISELQEDPYNPLSLKLLADAQAKAGQSADAQKTLTALAAISDERVETAFAVPQAKLALKANPDQSGRAGGAN